VGHLGSLALELVAPLYPLLASGVAMETCSGGPIYDLAELDAGGDKDMISCFILGQPGGGIESSPTNATAPGDTA
jgi:hypothetical protein